MAGTVTGIVRVKLDGQLLQSLEGSAEMEVGGFEREAVTGHTLYGFKEKFVASKLTFKLAWKLDTPVEKIRSAISQTLTWKADAGPVYSIGKAATTAIVKLSEKGEVEVEMMGAEAQVIIGV